MEALGNGAYRLDTLEGSVIPRTWNGTNLKFYFSGTIVFLPVVSIAFVCLRQSHVQFSLPSFVLSSDQTPENTKTKGTLEVVCTTTLKSLLG